MHLSLNAVACAMRTKNSGVQGRRARSARYAGCANVVCFDLDLQEGPIFMRLLWVGESQVLLVDEA